MTFKSRYSSTKALLKERAFLTRSLEEQQNVAAASEPLRRCLGSLDVLLLGLGSILGAGAFVLTGVAAHDHAGPAVAVSYALAAMAALLSALAYAEFMVDLPFAGGAFNCILLTFGELPGWVVACNLILEYTLSVAVCARAFSAYGATLFGQAPDSVLLHLGPFKLDFCALLLVLLLGVLLAAGTRESAAFNTVVTGMNLIAIVYVLLAGAPFGSAANLSPFAPFGARGVFAGASVVFFAFVGFDSVATVAEEVNNPSVDLPVGIVGAVSLCGCLYTGLCLVLCTMVPYNDISIDAPFPAAFLSLIDPSAPSDSMRTAFLRTSSRFVSFGALTGILTSTLVSLMGQARIYVVLGRERLLPPGLAAVHAERKTPVNATMLTALSGGVLALLVDLETLAELVSVGTLFVFFCVSAGLIWRRYCRDGSTDAEQAQQAATRLGTIVACSFAFSVSFLAGAPWWAVVCLGQIWLGAVAWLWQLQPSPAPPSSFTMPGSPLSPATAMLANLHLICSMSWQAYVRFAVWLLLSLGVYCLYGVHAAGGKETYLPVRGAQNGQRQDEREMMLDGRVSRSTAEQDGSGKQLELAAVPSGSDADRALEEGSGAEGGTVAESARGPNGQEGALVGGGTAPHVGGLALNGREGEQH